MKRSGKNTYPPAYKPFNLIGSKSVHFIGVMGIGVSSLAQWFLAQNWAVSGSDAAMGATYSDLKKAGLKANMGHKKANIPARCGLVIHSQAIKPDNPELAEARRRKLPVMSYPEAVGELTEFYKTISVSGMHGKSTTTAMAGLMLANTGFDPTIIVGTRLKEFGGNFRAGRGGYLVLEADEYKDAFLNYSPFFAITTNIDMEHLDYFKNIGRIKKSFLEFFSRVREGGTLILNRDNKILFSLKTKIEKNAEAKNIGVVWYSLNGKNAAKIGKAMSIPGKHNVSNALAVYELGKLLGIGENKIISSISKYKGAWRRMEYRGSCLISHIPCLIYDDYAHHPTEIKATLAAFREKFPKSEIICVFQPHQAERLKLLFKEFKTAFDDADKTMVMPVYKVAGREFVRASGPAKASKYDSESLVKSVQKLKPAREIFYLQDPRNLKNALNVLLSSRSFPCPLGKNGRIPRKSAVIVMMGAGDIVNYTDSLIR